MFSIYHHPRGFRLISRRSVCFRVNISWCLPSIAGDPVDQNGDLFSTPKQPSTATVDSRQPRQPGETPPGVIRTATEKKAAEEERRRQQEEEDRAKREEELRQKEEEERIRKENSFWNKALKGIKQFGKSIVEDE